LAISPSNDDDDDGAGRKKEVRMEKKEKIRGRDQKNHLGEIELNLLLYQKDRNQISEKLLSWLQYGTA